MSSDPSSSSMESISPDGGNHDKIKNENKLATAVVPIHRPATLFTPAPFSDEPAAIAERSNVNYALKITIEAAKSNCAPRPIRIYADGIYDLFHQGHSRQLMQAKTFFPNIYLIVGVCSDASTHSKKGKTVMKDTERYETVRHCRYVDEVLRDAPWTYDMNFIEEYKIDFVAHDEEPYATQSGDDLYAFLKERGMFIPTQRTEGVSTSDIVSRIIIDHDMYVMRNLARGYSPKDLNLGFVEACKFQLQLKIQTFKKHGKRVLDNLEARKMNWVHKWENFVYSFLILFGRDGMICHLWHESSGRILEALSPAVTSNEFDEDFELTEDEDYWPDPEPELDPYGMEKDSTNTDGENVSNVNSNCKDQETPLRSA